MAFRSEFTFAFVEFSIDGIDQTRFHREKPLMLQWIIFELFSFYIFLEEEEPQS